MPDIPFALDLPAASPLRRAAWRAARPLLNWSLAVSTYARLAAERREKAAARFAESALDVLNIRARCSPQQLARIPGEGPLVVTANHPHGGLDGLLLLDLVGRARPDVRLLANRLLARVPELRDVCFFVDPFNVRTSASRSVAGLRAATRWVRRGGALIVFPAGEVAYRRGADGLIVDSPWRATVGRLIASTQARVVAAHIEGKNSTLFYAAARVHPLLRTALLPRELLRSRGRAVAVSFGVPVRAAELAEGSRAEETITATLRDRTERLRPSGAPVAPPVCAAALADEVGALPASAKLITSGALSVFCATASSIPHVLAEIGRLREITFRAVGEGTGRPSDLDMFDEHYEHLFLWDTEKRAVVGAYRLGCTDAIVPRLGVAGLYTRTLFDYDEGLFERLPPVLELGRSFVRAEYQRNSSALLLLWKGICAFIANRPRYRVLLGAVSISARYSDRTRELLMAFLRQNHLEGDLAGVVRPRHPCRSDDRATAGIVPTTSEEAEAAVSKLERDGRGMPVLLRQYLKLNARVLGFSVDPSFGDALDALMMVDLTRADRRVLARYFGSAPADAYLRFHGEERHRADAA